MTAPERHDCESCGRQVAVLVQQRVTFSILERNDRDQLVPFTKTITVWQCPPCKRGAQSCQPM